ncbi:MAG: hypothetical protein GTN80_06500 [Nitrososphaeria archaeon]|nr:hypothetical protein [Nitrososphaeria archaeon]NIQ33277.1 hypothetical protein [Nitrososphaeria archaeon]
MRTDELKEIILKNFWDKKFYGYDAYKKLISNNIKVELSRIYRVLNEMLREELIEFSWENSQQGPRKKIYCISKKGNEQLNNILLDAINTVHSFYGKYLMNLPSKVNPIDKFINSLVNEVPEEGNLGYIIQKYSTMNEKIIEKIHYATPQKKIYLIKPDSITIRNGHNKIDNLIFLNGTYQDIYLKNDYLCLLIIVNIPEKDFLEEAVKEWHRVLNQAGKLTIVVPTIFISKYEDPLTLGDFIEKFEHEITNEDNHFVDAKFLKTVINKFFNKIVVQNFGHMTMLSAAEPFSKF